jgi:TRAP-type C4-dicarboxylate transport system permease small subunit
MVSSGTSVLERLDRFGRALENIALVGLLGLLIGVGVGEIILREVFGTGLSWADETNRLTVLWLAMIATVAACRENRHIRIDALGHLLPATAVRVSRVIVDVFAAGVCFVIAWHAYRYLLLEFEFEDTVLIDTPAWIMHVIVPIGFGLTGYRFLVGAAKRAVGKLDDPPQGPVL